LVVAAKPGSERLQPEFVEPFLASGLVVDVMDDVVLGTGHAEEVSKLIDHQPDCGVLADAFGVDVFVLADLAAGVSNRQCDTARIAGAWVDDHQRVSKAAAMGAFWFRHG
jgi:hypothetical protein